MYKECIRFLIPSLYPLGLMLLIVFCVRGVGELGNQVGELGSFGVGELGSFEITHDLLKITHG